MMGQTIGKGHRPLLSPEMVDKALIHIPREERIQQVEKLISMYIKEYGHRPRNQDLELLTDIILYEELSDTNPHKVAHNDYPILSSTQPKRRMYGRGTTTATNMKGEIRMEMELSGVQLMDHQDMRT